VIATLCHVRVRFGWLLAVLIAGCGLVACTTTSGSHDPTSSAPSSTFQPSTPTTTTPTPTGPKTTGAGVLPGERPPVLDPIAKEHSALGAHEFAVFYIKALDWSKATTDPYLLRQISAPSCAACRTDIDNISKLEADGDYIKSGRLAINSTETVKGNGAVKADYTVKFGLKQEPVVVVNPTATATQVRTETTFVSYVYVSWEQGRWLVIERTGER
jgi:hypothetical protein